jgi:hypothetical protein
MLYSIAINQATESVVFRFKAPNILIKKDRVHGLGAQVSRQLEPFSSCNRAKQQKQHAGKTGRAGQRGRLQTSGDNREE